MTTGPDHRPAPTAKPGGELAEVLAALDLPAAAWETVRLARGEVLFDVGAAADAFYVLSDGRLEVYLSDAELGKVVLEELTAGAAFGELALLDGGVRTASVAALTDATLRALRRDVFRTALRRSPDMAVTLLEVVGERLRRNLRYLDYLIAWARLVSDGQYEAARAAITREAAAFGGDTAQFADTFAAMVAAVKAREDLLLGTLATLRIEIDQDLSARQVAEVTDTDFFRALQREARLLRAEESDNADPG